MINYSVKVDEEQVAEAISLFTFVGGNTDDAMRVAINKTAPKVKTRSSSEIRAQVRLSAAYVGDKITVTKASRSFLEARIKTPSRGLLLSKFSTDSQVSGEKVGWILPPPNPPQGIKVKVKPDGETKSPGPNTFYMVLPKSHALAIVKRKSTVGPQGGTIDVLYGPSISQVFSDVKDDVTPFAKEELTAQLLDAMRYLLVKQHPVE